MQLIAEGTGSKDEVSCWVLRPFMENEVLSFRTKTYLKLGAKINMQYMINPKL